MSMGNVKYYTRAKLRLYGEESNKQRSLMNEQAAI
jgi:hypothetical protein